MRAKNAAPREFGGNRGDGDIYNESARILPLATPQREWRALREVRS